MVIAGRGRPALRSIGVLKLALDQAAPDFIRLPDGMEVSLGVGAGGVLAQDTVKKHESGDALVGGAMNEDPAVGERVHDAAKGAEILGSGRLEIHGDMDVSHAEAGNDTSLVGESVVRGWEGEIDDRFKAGFADDAKLVLGGLAGGAQSVTKGVETINFGQHGR